MMETRYRVRRRCRVLREWISYHLGDVDCLLAATWAATIEEEGDEARVVVAGSGRSVYETE